MVIAAPDTIQPANQAEALRFSRRLQAPIKAVYEAVTHPDHLVYWISDGARAQATVGGYLLLTWYPNRYVVGEFRALDPDTRVVLSWRAGGESAPSEVEIALSPDGDATALTVTHRDLAEEASADAYTAQWDAALDNLVSYLATGADLRLTNRVLLGIIPGDLNAEIAARLGVPVTEGVRVNGLVPGLSAERAGLQHDDVIVAVDGLKLNAETPIQTITGRRRPGDIASVTYYRGGQSRDAELTLLGYPIPPLPADYAALAARYRTEREAVSAQLHALLDGATEAEAAHKPAPGEWNVNEVLAHLILTERNLQNMLGSIVVEGPWPEGWSTNNDARITGVTTAYGGKAALVEALDRAWLETEKLVAALPDNGKKGAFWWVSFELYSFGNHIQEHLRQIEAALRATRG